MTTHSQPCRGSICRLLAPLEIDRPAPITRRNCYRAEVPGRTPLDRVLRLTAGEFVEISLAVWGGTFVCITGDFGRARSHAARRLWTK